MTPLVISPAPRLTSVSHTCSNCGRPAQAEAQVTFHRDSAAYSCPTCGQREAVLWYRSGSGLVEDVQVLEEPYVILGEC